MPAGLVYFNWSLLVLYRALIVICALYFTVSFVYKKIPHVLNLIASVLLLPVIILLPTTLNVVEFDLLNCEAVNGSLWYYIYALEIGSIIFFTIWAIREYFKFVFSKAPERLQNTFLLISCVFLLAIISASTIIGNLTLEYEVNLVGPIGMLILLMTLTYLIAEFKAFDIKLAGAQALVLGLLALVGSLLFVAKSDSTRIVAAATFIFTAITGFFLVRSVKKEIKQREQIELLAQDLKKANERLKELDKAKSEFVSIASHQLRSPLTSIRGYASMLVEGSFGKMPEKALESAKRIEESAKLMAYSIEDYLNVSRIEAGNMKYNLTDFNLRDMADNICDDLRPEALKQNLILLFRTDLMSRAIVNADVGKTNQIIHNLINNSIKYTPKGSINVFMRDNIKKKRIYIDITDTGIGMTEETRAKLFNKFSRADNANSVNVSGTGLGLFVAIKMAEAMGGTITAHSEGPNKGSTFTFELPLAL